MDVLVASAAQGVTAALTTLAADAAMQALMKDLRDRLSALTPGVDPSAFTLGVQGSSTDAELLREFELLLSHGGASVPVTKQSNGLAQLAIFATLLSLLPNEKRAVLLVDEPEVSLHPHAQRALSAALLSLPNQTIIATHSSNVLDRADLRNVIRFQSTPSGIKPNRATALTDAEAQRLARFVNPLTAEACFARKVVLVEGYSDRVVLLQVATRLGRDLDAEGISIVSLDGGAAIGTFLRLFGAPGLNLDVLGMCDADKESYWLSEIGKINPAVSDRVSMERAGYFVCSRDLEDEFIGALGIPAAEAIVAREGMGRAFESFCNQPSHVGVQRAELLRRYFHNDNTRWAVPLAMAVDVHHLPRALDALLARL